MKPIFFLPLSFIRVLALMVSLVLCSRVFAHAPDTAANAVESSPSQEILKIKSSRNGLIELQRQREHLTEETPLLLIQGLTFDSPPTAWIKPLRYLSKKPHALYFFKWSRFKSLQFNKEQLRKALLSLLDTHKNIDVFGYSAGGVIALLALDSLVGTPFYSRVHLRTVATPFFGYAAPKRLAYLGAPFAGMSAVQIGVGAHRFLQHKRLEGCQQWITTNCKLDQHACIHRGISPERGHLRNLPEMPCGNENLTLLDQESHESSLFAVIQTVFP